MSKLKLQKYRVFILSAICLLAIDLASKYYIMSKVHGQITFIKGFFYISPQINRGIAFGIDLNFAFQLIASMLILGILIYNLWNFDES